MRYFPEKTFFLIPYFIEIQRKSFSDFLEKGIIKELFRRNPITNAKNDLELVFFPEKYQLTPPEFNSKQAIFNVKTYACKLYVPAQLTNWENNQVTFQWVLLGNLPLMTKRGHFIINGSARVIVNQLVRSPGIYYQEAIDITKKKIVYADLISQRGAWLRLEIDKKKRVWAKMKKTPKISILVFLQAIGFDKDLINKSIHFSEFLENSKITDEKKTIYQLETQEQALMMIYALTHPKYDKTKITIEKGQKFLFRKFFNPRTYDLGQLGRVRLNKKLGLSIPLTHCTLTPQDVLFAIDYLINLEYGFGCLDDIDHLKNRRVRASGELIQNQFGTGLIRLEKIIREKMKKPKNSLTLKNLITTKALDGALREFFGSSPLSQYMDQTNPLAEITHKRRLSSLGPGGISRETAGMAIRGIHPTHYGRICPIETPEGKNAGLVNSPTILTRINSQGFLETPFYPVFQGQIQKQIGPFFFSAEQEQQINAAPGDLNYSHLNFLSGNLLPIRNQDEYKRVFRNQVEYIGISPIQMISVATSLIPFLEHDDANRALMGSNMQRQAVPLINPERPIVGTGLEARVVSDSGHIIQASQSGFVSYVSGNKIIIQSYSVFKDLENSNKISNFKNLKKINSLKNEFPSIWNDKKTDKTNHYSKYSKKIQNKQIGLKHQINDRLGINKNFDFQTTTSAVQPVLCTGLRENYILLKQKIKRNLKIRNIHLPLDSAMLKQALSKSSILTNDEIKNFSLINNPDYLSLLKRDSNKLFSLYTTHIPKCDFKSGIYQWNFLVNHQPSRQKHLITALNPLKNNVKGMPVFKKHTQKKNNEVWNVIGWSFPSEQKCKITNNFKSFQTLFALKKIINPHKIIFSIKTQNYAYKKSQFLFKIFGTVPIPSNEILIQLQNKKNFKALNLNKSFTVLQKQNNVFKFTVKYNNVYSSKTSIFSSVFNQHKTNVNFSVSKKNKIQKKLSGLGYQLKSVESKKINFHKQSTFCYFDNFISNNKNKFVKVNKQKNNLFFAKNIFQYRNYHTSTGCFKPPTILYSPQDSYFLRGKFCITGLTKKINTLQQYKIPDHIETSTFSNTKHSAFTKVLKSNSLTDVTFNIENGKVNQGVQTSWPEGAGALKSKILAAQSSWCETTGTSYRDNVPALSIGLFNKLKQIQLEILFQKKIAINAPKGDSKLSSGLSKSEIFTVCNGDFKIKNFNKNHKNLKKVLPLQSENLVPLKTVYSNPFEFKPLNCDWKEITTNFKFSNNFFNIQNLTLSGLESLTIERFLPATTKTTDVPKTEYIEYNLQNYHRSNQDTCLHQKPVVHQGEWVQKSDILADCAASVAGELALGKNLLIAYMPWEGYNFEDAILISERLVYDDILTSIHIERYEIEIRDTDYGIEQITKQIPELFTQRNEWQLEHLNEKGIAKLGSWVKEGDILVGKITPMRPKPLSPQENLVYDIVGKKIPTTCDTSLRVPKGVEGRVIKIQILDTETVPSGISFSGPGRVHIYLAEKRKIQVGDKMAGRHGNKGIVSKILPRQDMPYLLDGTPIDMVLNPLGVPSRMNVGQIFECLLGLAGTHLQQQYRVNPFDEFFGPEASRSLVYLKLYQARLKSGQHWLFNPEFPGKTRLVDGRTGECFDQSVTVGRAYMLKLVHLVDEKIHARSTGPYSLITQQPLGGRSKHGGQRLGEMEVWALEGFGAAYTLQELLTIKSDDVKGRHQVLDAILNNESISFGTPESFKVLVRELQSLCLDVNIFTISAAKRKSIDIMKIP
uniref:DNA-directed RNA polymerase subunit beta n=1 Tax=Lobosphaera incisa TaxID=312850 RepID=A0A097KM59_9CHLO|nr:beta subunit of RNA polymerase [Lobosphaera incisa]AIT94262.1 beta subunit of RNA polymerase [Lobosphaera incisa]